MFVYDKKLQYPVKIAAVGTAALAASRRSAFRSAMAVISISGHLPSRMLRVWPEPMLP